MKYRIAIILALILSVAPFAKGLAQHTIGINAGPTVGSFRPYPALETKSVAGLYTGGLSWRYYSPQLAVGSVGVDIEFLQRGFSYAPYAAFTEEGETDYYYTRKLNSIMVPLVWQPHVYMINRRVRLFLDAAITFSYNMSSSYTNDAADHYYHKEDWKGDYIYKTARDNRFGYGLMGGVGINYLFGRFEIMARMRYYFGYSDIVKNRNKYYGNNIDGSENPFFYSPIRSPLDNVTLSFGLNYRLGRGAGFSSWKRERTPKAELGKTFNYTGKTKQ